MPSKILNMKQFEEMSDEDFYNLMPELFINDAEIYVRRFGKTDYQRLINVVIATDTCLIKLNDGSALDYKHSYAILSPVSEFSMLN